VKEEISWEEETTEKEEDAVKEAETT